MVLLRVDFVHYMGIKYGFGYVIAGGPQTKIGNYLSVAAPEVVEFIAGGQEEDDIEYLNRLLYDLLDYPPNKFPQSFIRQLSNLFGYHSKNFPKIFIHVGKGDHHYNGHVLPLVQELDKRNINYQLDIANYFFHDAIISHYADYLIKTLNSIDNDIISIKSFINDVNIEYEHNSLKLTCNTMEKKLKYACHIFKDNKCIEKIIYQKENTFRYPIQSNGIYRAMLFVMDKRNNINSKVTDEIEIVVKSNV